MDTHSHKDTLKTALSGARRKIFAQSATVISVRTAIIALPVAAILIAIDQRWGGSSATLAVGVIALLAIVLSPLCFGLALLGTHFRSALTIDDRASLKNRLSSAWEFLHDGELNEARRVQVNDAVSHASALNYGALFGRRMPGASPLLPLAIAAFAVSFLVPEYAPGEFVEAPVDARTEYQLSELRALEEEIEEALAETANEELEAVLEMLREVEGQFGEGEIRERDVMIQLARMDDQLQRKMTEMGVENLENEVDSLAAPFEVAEVGADVAAALEKGEFSEASEALKKLAEKMAALDITPEEMARLAKSMEKTAAEFGEFPDASTFKGDLERAAAALKNPNPASFNDAAQSMASKVLNVEKLRRMKDFLNRFKVRKFNLGQAPKGGKEGLEDDPALGVDGFEQGKVNGQQGTVDMDGIGKGGLEAGRGVTGDPFGESSRLADSYRELLKIQGMIGGGPTETKIEYGDADEAESQLSTKELYAEYAAVAEQAIEREEILLSHRFHVKRYFQAIKPVDEE
jgi:hypothetical protein